MSHSSIVEYLNNTMFVHHPMGNYACYGLNTIGCNSIIRYNDEIMQFYAFESGSNNAIYITKYGKKVIINPYDKTLKINRLIDVNDLNDEDSENNEPSKCDESSNNGDESSIDYDEQSNDYDEPSNKRFKVDYGEPSNKRFKVDYVHKYTDIINYLNSTEFLEHPFGNYALYGLNNFGCESIINYNDEIMKFYAFKSGSNNAIYITKSGKEVIINPYDDTLNITRLIDIKDARNYSVSFV